MTVGASERRGCSALAHGVWLQQGNKLTGGGEVGAGNFGFERRLSASGNTELIGGLNDNSGVGAAWVFVNPPTVTTGLASSVTQASATLHATVNPDGQTVSDCHFDYGTSVSYGSSVPCLSLPGSGNSPVAVSAAVEGLSQTTTYHFRIVATNASGTSRGSDGLFTTLANTPTVLTGEASLVAPTSAALNATVNPNGETVSDCHFDYGTSVSYGSSVPCSSLPGSGTSAVEVSAPVRGLSTDTTYHFRIVATNPSGTSNGSDQSFTTPREAEYGTCAAKKKGEYAEADCLLKPSKARKGTYEWDPGAASACVAMKKGFYSEAGCKTRDEKKGQPKGKYERAPGPGYRSTSGTVTLEAPGLGGGTVVCAASTGAGEVTGLRAGVDRITFTGCEAFGKACTSEGPNSTPSDQAGVIATNLLDTRLVGPVSGQVWTEFVSAEHEPYLSEFGCEGPIYRTTGSLAGAQAGNVNVSSLTSTTTFAIGEGEQALYTELSETGGASWVGPDASSLVTVASNTSASATEIKTGL